MAEVEVLIEMHFNFSSLNRTILNSQVR